VTCLDTTAALLASGVLGLLKLDSMSKFSGYCMRASHIGEGQCRGCLLASGVLGLLTVCLNSPDIVESLSWLSAGAAVVWLPLNPSH